MDFRVQELCTIEETIRYHAQLRSAWPAIVASESLPLSYGELFEKICTVRGDLYQAGFDRNSRVVIALQNGPLAALTVVAVASSAVAVPIDIELTLPEVNRSFAGHSPCGGRVAQRYPVAGTNRRGAPRHSNNRIG